MHYYTKHPGDYMRDAGHLSLLEHGIYNRLLDIAYSTEAPLPADSAMLARKLGARSPEERTAMETLLAEFFYATPEGWRHRRVEREISGYQEKITQCSKASIARWGRPKGQAAAPQAQHPAQAPVSPPAQHPAPAQTAPHADAMRPHTARNANQEPPTLNQQPRTPVPPVSPKGEEAGASFSKANSPLAAEENPLPPARIKAQGPAQALTQTQTQEQAQAQQQKQAQASPLAAPATPAAPAPAVTAAASVPPAGASPSAPARPTGTYRQQAPAPAASGPSGQTAPQRAADRRRGSLEELRAYAQHLGLPASDGDFMFAHWTSNGWRNGLAQSRDWQAGMRKWQLCQWLPSQRHSYGPGQWQGQGQACHSSSGSSNHINGHRPGQSGPGRGSSPGLPGRCIPAPRHPAYNRATATHGLSAEDIGLFAPGQQ